MKPAAQWFFESQELCKILCEENAHSVFTLDSVNKNQFVYALGDTADSVFFVKKGRVKIFYYTQNKLEIVKAILSSGGIFGELALAGETERIDYAQSITYRTPP
jgi:CRP-like cAMP-binding protein